ncbi:hydroxyethylthiazole kinase [Pedobacter frigidisoli]|uniref:hydroxyethylthiazole kinase n=1 Tax=Pedobacter frigidisoli TaxID=2530455 RepID=UPI0029306AAF|nr:hydroxyethylthiazole kinase [Pedobacter frigidisoli]
MESEIVKNLISLREGQPLVHSITNYVVMNNTANALLAIGASPLMSHAHPEQSDIAKISNALVINIGTLDEYWVNSMLLAIHEAKAAGKPWVLDPVGAGASNFRNEVLHQFLHLGPTVIRGNASEIMAIAKYDVSSKGVDSVHQSAEAIRAATMLSEQTGAVVCISGETDYIVHRDRLMAVHNGHPLMARVTGMGCTATAIIAAFLPFSTGIFDGVCSAMAIMGICGEMAGKLAQGSGSFQMAFYDALYQIDEQQISVYLK